MPWHGKAFYLPLQQPPGPGYLRTYRNFQTPGQRQHYGRYDKKTPGTQGIPGNRIQGTKVITYDAGGSKETLHNPKSAAIPVGNYSDVLKYI